MRHLFMSVVRVERMAMSTNNGRAVMTWVPQGPPLNYVTCRLDVGFMRPGRDAPMPIEAGKAPDRVGLLFCDVGTPLLAGDRVTAIPDGRGRVLVPGTFEIRAIPDRPLDYTGPHHLEVQVVEVAQAVALTSQFDGVPGPS